MIRILTSKCFGIKCDTSPFAICTHARSVACPLCRWKRCANMFSLSFYDLSSTSLDPSFIYIQKFSWWLNFNDTLILTKCYHVRCQKCCSCSCVFRAFNMYGCVFFSLHINSPRGYCFLVCVCVCVWRTGNQQNHRIKDKRTFVARISQNIYIPKHFLSIKSRWRAHVDSFTRWNSSGMW